VDLDADELAGPVGPRPADEGELDEAVVAPEHVLSLVQVVEEVRAERGFGLLEQGAPPDAGQPAGDARGGVVRGRAPENHWPDRLTAHLLML
jgi:hypothetical protein